MYFEDFGITKYTTFWEDFSIADTYQILGLEKNSIKDTYDRALKYAENDYRYLTELVLVLNWKIWQHWEEGHQEVAKIYDKLWQKTESLAYKTLKDNELKYFITTID